jgi:uncharacterized membrane-anchored protein
MGVSAVALALALGAVAAPSGAKDPPKEAPAAAPAGVPPEVLAMQKGLHPQTGDVRIPEAKAVLHLGDRYYFLPADEAKRVLVDAWRNPPSFAEGVLGMVFEKGTTIYNGVWGAVITYKESGHVPDADAHEQDYASVLKSMQEGVEADNVNRKAQGYPPMHLIGWAQPPSYDAANHSLIWAREVSIEGDKENGLNYDVRLLGRTGVLSLNMLASMSSLDQVRTSAAEFGKSVTFEQGATYADFNPSIDKTAEYGLAGLVAGGVAVVAAKKLGLLALALGFGKKFILLIGLALAGIAGFFRKMFGRNKADDEEGTL